MGDLGDFGESPSALFSENCSRGGGLRGLITPPSKSSSAVEREREFLMSRCPLKSNSKSASFSTARKPIRTPEL